VKKKNQQQHMWFYLHFTVMWLPNLNMSPEPKHAWDVHFTQSLAFYILLEIIFMGYLHGISGQYT
jgi:hypothetical protein